MNRLIPIKKSLLKEIKLNIFRNNLNDKVKIPDENSSLKSLRILLGTVALEGKPILQDLTYDLNIVFLLEKNKFEENSHSIEFKSKLAKKLYKKINIAENKVKDSVKFISKGSKNIMKILISNFEEDSYIVGGFVRDSISDYDSHDVDLCTSIPYNKLENVFNDNGWKTKAAGKQFLVLNVQDPETEEYFEIAALRKDKDNNGPETGTIFEDAQRRDFTNSAIYWSLKEKILIDPNGEAIFDCQDNLIRFVGKAKDRLDEDPLRTIRFFKFLNRGWKTDKKSLQAVRTRLQEDNKKVMQLQSILSLPCVKEAIELERNKREEGLNGNKPTISLSFEKLSETIIPFERIRLELEKMVGIL